MRLLIIDGDSRHGEALVERLASSGHDAYFTGRLDEAEWLARLFRFDLALVDLDLPQVTGPEVVRFLRSLSPGLEAAIMSSREEAGDGARLHGDLPLFAKPVRLEALAGLLDRLASRRRGAAIMVRQRFALAHRVGS
jgi:DNA-binding response OmpR family regulator